MHLIFLFENPRQIGGGGYALYMFAEELAKKNHKITLFGLDIKNKFLINRKIPNNITFFSRPSFPRKFKGAGRIDDMLKIHFWRVISDYVKKNKCDYIVGSLRETAIIASKLAQKHKIKSLNFVYETPPLMEFDLRNRWINEYKGKFKKSWENTKKAYLDSNILISNSKLTKKYCENWLGKSIDGYVYPGVNLNEIPKVASKKRDQIIYIGRLNEYKNIDWVIKALAKIRNAPNFLILGDGEEKKTLEKLARKLNVKIQFLGGISDKIKWKLIQNSKFMVFPSSHEGFGMPPMEALICKVPCICTNKAIFKEVYRNYVEYFLENDIDNLSEKIEFLINNPEYCKKRGEQGFKYIIKRYSWQKSAAKIEKIIS